MTQQLAEIVEEQDVFIEDLETEIRRLFFVGKLLTNDLVVVPVSLPVGGNILNLLMLFLKV